MAIHAIELIYLMHTVHGNVNVTPNRLKRSRALTKHRLHDLSASNSKDGQQSVAQLQLG